MRVYKFSFVDYMKDRSMDPNIIDKMLIIKKSSSTFSMWLIIIIMSIDKVAVFKLILTAPIPTKKANLIIVFYSKMSSQKR